jgi:hypothetical protein
MVAETELHLLHHVQFTCVADLPSDAVLAVDLDLPAMVNFFLFLSSF